MKQQKDKEMPLCGSLFLEKGIKKFPKLGEEGTEFNASTGWLYKQKMRYEISQLDTSQEKLTADSNALDIYKTKFDETLRY